MKNKLTYLFMILIIILLFGCNQKPSEPLQEKINVPTPTQDAQLNSSSDPNIPTKEPGCTVRSEKPTPDPTREALLPPPTDEDWKRGAENAYVTIIEYADYQCPACSTFSSILKELSEDYRDDLQIIYRHFPLSSHDKAQLATQAAEAAGIQGGFWEMNDLLFENREQWVTLSEEDFKKWLLEQAENISLDVNQFEKDMMSDEIQALVKNSWERNAAIGMPGTPFLMINGYPYNGPLSYSDLAATIEMILLEKIQFNECPEMMIDPEKQYFANIETEKGLITLELFPKEAPLAVNNFIFLSQQGWYDGVTFHRVIPGFVAQAGDPSGTGYGGPGYAFDNEISDNRKFDRPGMVAMANAGPGSNGSQFFITYSAVPRLDGNYSIFAQVISGMEIAENLSPRDPSKSSDLLAGDEIIQITIEEK